MSQRKERLTWEQRRALLGGKAEPLLTAVELALYLGIHVKTVLSDKTRFKPVGYIGRNPRYRKSSVDAALRGEDAA